MSATDANLARVFQEQEAAEERERDILKRLLRKVADRKGHVLVHASAMGRILNGSGVAAAVPSYAATHTLEWIADTIKLGSQMPFMETKIDQRTGKLIIDRENAEEVKQRAPDWTRQPALTAYLAQPQRKFGPIIAVVSPDWVDNPAHPNWDDTGRARKGAAEFTPLDVEGRVGLLT